MSYFSFPRFPSECGGASFACRGLGRAAELPRLGSQAELGIQGNWSHLLSRDPLLRRMALKRLAWRLPGRPIIYFLYSYLFRRGFLDGKDGLVFCIMKSIYQYMVVIKKYDQYRTAKVQGRCN